MNCKEEVVIITGGAAGIGLAAARAFAAEGAHVLITGRRAARLEEISRVEDRIEHLVADAADPEDAQLTIAKAVELWGRVDVLVNNAGAGLPKPLAETTAEYANGVYAVNTVGPTLLAAAAVPYRIQRIDHQHIELARHQAGGRFCQLLRQQSRP